MERGYQQNCGNATQNADPPICCALLAPLVGDLIGMERGYQQNCGNATQTPTLRSAAPSSHLWRFIPKQAMHGEMGKLLPMRIARLPHVHLLDHLYYAKNLPHGLPQAL